MWSKPILLDREFAQNHYIETGHDYEADSFGIEVELEGQKIRPPNDNTAFYTYWQRTEDGSLRKLVPGDEAWEYRFRRAFNMEETEKAVTAFCDYMTKPDVKVYNSGRTSIHVHVNCCKETLATVYNYITLAYIFEELLVSKNGVDRVGNNFCLRAKDAQGLIVGMAQSINSRGDLAGFSRDHRYASTNVASLFKFGTIEFRSLECTTDKTRIMNWIKVLQKLKESARKFKNPTEIISQFSLRGPERFIVDQLGIVLAMPYLRDPEHVHMIMNGVRLVQEFAHSSSWEPMKKANKDEDPFKAKLRGAIAAQAAAQAVQNQWGAPPAPGWGQLVQPAQPAVNPFNNMWPLPDTEQ